MATPIAAAGIARALNALTYAGPQTSPITAQGIAARLEKAAAWSNPRLARLSGLQLDADNFLAAARAFPLGLERMDGSFVVRDPVHQEGDCLVCIGEVAPQSTLHILHGKPEVLLEAAGHACREALRGGAEVAGVMLVGKKG